MKFCSHCGARLEGDERFCVACGTPVSAGVGAGVDSGSPAAPAPPIAATPTTVPLAPPAGIPVAYAMPGSIPVAAHAPAPANHAGKVWVAIFLVVLLAGSYYYSKHKPAAATAPAAPAQPGTSGQPADNAALAQQQSFAGHWKAIYGNVEVTNASWTNHSSVAIQSATLRCDQYAANGADLSQIRTTLNGPVQPGSTTIFNPFQMGSVSAYMSRVNCVIVAVTPAN